METDERKHKKGKNNFSLRKLSQEKSQTNLPHFLISSTSLEFDAEQSERIFLVIYDLLNCMSFHFGELFESLKEKKDVEINDESIWKIIRLNFSR